MATDHALPRRFTCPWISPEEAAPLTTSFEAVCADKGTALRAVLEEHGVAVITGVIDPSGVAGLHAAWDSDLGAVIDSDGLSMFGGSPLAKAAHDVRQKGHIAWPAATAIGHEGFALDHGVAQGKFAWGVRAHPNVRTAFSHVYGLEPADICCSLDVVFWTPHRAASADACDTRSWPHSDQNRHDHRVGWVDVFQGVLYASEAGPADAGNLAGPGSSTTVVWPGSHLAPYDDLMASPPMKAQGNYCEIKYMVPGPERTALWEAWLGGARRMCVPAGGLLVWSSRVIHQGFAGGLRLAQPVCWEPVDRRPPTALARKLRLVALGLPSTHWASLGEQHPMATSVPHGTPGDPDAQKLPLVPCLPLAHRPHLSMDAAQEAAIRRALQGNKYVKPDVLPEVEAVVAPAVASIM